MPSRVSVGLVRIAQMTHNTKNPIHSQPQTDIPFMSNPPSTLR